MTQARPLYLTADVGTSSLKAVVYSQEGEILGLASRRYAYRSEHPGWAESDPADWWTALHAALVDLRGQGLALSDVAAVAFTGQMHTAVLLDRAGQVLPPTILWLDRRAAAETEELTARLGLPPYQINSTYTLPKLLWLKRRRPEVMAQVQAILWPKDYLRYRLTGVICTDTTEPGGAALLDWDTGAWATERLTLVGLAPAVLPPMRQPDEIVGPPLAAVAAELGINPEAQVLVGMGDVAALVGGAPPEPGRVVCSLGSSSMIFMALAQDQRPADPQHRLYTYPLGPCRLLGGVSSTTGAALVWAYQNIARLDPPDIGFEQVMADAAQLEPGADGLRFLPYLAGERSPYWSDDIQGGFYGFRLSHGSRQVFRAIMEGIAFSLRHLLDIYRELGVPVRELALAGGGAQTPGLCQIIADVCGMDVAIYAEAETVTRVLYALCQKAITGADFGDALAGTFPEPEVIWHRPELTARYESAYASYRRFAAFALEEATSCVTRTARRKTRHDRIEQAAR